ncbi:MAG TPA: hypothetical protein VEI01_12585 [Terriglobales bacterium]|nr:hypothetical protein [Terriglobales bacterium]
MRRGSSRSGDEPVSLLQPGRHLDLSLRGLAERDVAKCGNLVLVEKEDALHRPTLYHGGLRNQQRPTLSARWLCPAEITVPKLPV